MIYFTKAVAAERAKPIQKMTQNRNSSFSFSYYPDNSNNELNNTNGWRGPVVKIRDCGNFFKEFTKNEQLQLSREPGPIPGAGLCLLEKGSKKMNIFQTEKSECLHLH